MQLIFVWHSLKLRLKTAHWFLTPGGKNAFGVKCARCGPGRWHSSGALCCHAHNLISAVTSRHQFAGLNIRCAARSPISGDREHHFSPSHLWANGQHSHWKWPCLLFQQEEIVQMLGALSGSRCGRASWVDNWKDRLFFLFFFKLRLWHPAVNHTVPSSFSCTRVELNFSLKHFIYLFICIYKKLLFSVG